MILEVTYSDGHHECFDSNSLTGGAVFGRANILTEFDVVWEEGEDGQHLVVYEHHMEEWIGYIFLDDFGRTKPAFLNSTGVMYPSVECILKLLYQCT